jgi:hypothetical protein
VKTTADASGAHDGTSSYTVVHASLVGGKVAITVLFRPSGSIVVISRFPSKWKIPFDATIRPLEPQSASQ